MGVAKASGFTAGNKYLHIVLVVIPAQAGIQCGLSNVVWIPACAGMTRRNRADIDDKDFCDTL